MGDFWNVEGNTLRIEGEINSDGWDWWNGRKREGSATRLRNALSKMHGDVVVWLSSPGGSVVVGSEIYTMLRAYNGKVRVIVDGLAASAASVIAMAGDEVVMSPTAYMMIHCASTAVYGNRQAMEQGVEMLEEVDKGIISAYQRKTGRSAEELQVMMERETWMNAARAKELGFCDRILFEEEEEEGAAPQEDAVAQAYNQGRTRTDVAASWLSREGERQNTLQDCVACAGGNPFAIGLQGSTGTLVSGFADACANDLQARLDNVEAAVRSYAANVRREHKHVINLQSPSSSEQEHSRHELRLQLIASAAGMRRLH